MKHRYRKKILPRLRESWWIRLHRDAGHRVVHFGMLPTAGAGRCYWVCTCKARHWC